MKKLFLALAFMAFSTASAVAQQKPAWIAVSDGYTRKLIAVDMKHTPENGSGEGLAEFDPLVMQPTYADEDQETRETRALLAEFTAAIPQQKYKEVAQDLQIIIDKVELQLKQLEYARAHKVPFYNASTFVFAGLRVLLDEQTPEARRPSAVARLRKYAGLEPGFRPLTDILRERVTTQMAKPDMIYPAKSQIDTEMSRNSSYITGIASLFEKFELKGWQEPFETLKTQLAEYDAWTKANVLPKARTDFRLRPEEYALALQNYGISATPEQLAAQAHAAFDALQKDMQPLASRIAKERNLPSSDYRDVIRELKKQQVVGEAILPLYQQRLKQVETIISNEKLVTLPERPARIRIATAAETAQQPAPHMDPPPFMNNTGEKGEFVLPMNIPAAEGAEALHYDDFSFDAAAWTLIAHEARPGHELQFDSMLEHGVSLARVQYAFNSTNVEGWGLYAEYITLPSMPPEGQLISLDYRLLRAARMFLDPELQMGKIQPADAFRVLEQDVVQSKAMATQEVERYTYRSPGQATSYYYGFAKLLDLRKDVEQTLGKKFDTKKFHDFVLAQGLLPPELMRKAVLEDFVPKQ